MASFPISTQFVCFFRTKVLTLKTGRSKAKNSHRFPLCFVLLRKSIPPRAILCVPFVTPPSSPAAESAPSSASFFCQCLNEEHTHHHDILCVELYLLYLCVKIFFWSSFLPAVCVRCAVETVGFLWLVQCGLCALQPQTRTYLRTGLFFVSFFVYIACFACICAKHETCTFAS